MAPGGFGRNSGDNIKHLNLKPQQELVKNNQEELRNATNAPMNNINNNNANFLNPKFHIQEAQEKDGWFITPETYHKNFLLPCLPTHLYKGTKNSNDNNNNNNDINKTQK